MLGAMNSEAKFSVPPLLSLLLGLTVLNELFVLVIVLRYSYNRLTLVASAVGAIILLALSSFSGAITSKQVAKVVIRSLVKPAQ